MADDLVPQSDPKALDEDTTVLAASDWSDYRKDYGVSADPETLKREHQLFLAGWRAGYDRTPR